MTRMLPHVRVYAGDRKTIALRIHVGIVPVRMVATDVAVERSVAGTERLSVPADRDPVIAGAVVVVLTGAKWSNAYLRGLSRMRKNPLPRRGPHLGGLRRSQQTF